MCETSGRCDIASNCYRFEEHDATDDDMTFCMSNYAREALKMMFMMRSHGMLTDVVLEVKKELFPAHKVVLSAASPYFKAMFTGGLKEAEMSRVQLQGVSSAEATPTICLMDEQFVGLLLSGLSHGHVPHPLLHVHRPDTGY